jgi:DNA polymerase III subunit delta'
MSFAEIQDQEQVKTILQNGIRSGTLSHAYIFAGASGTGRKKMALALSKAMFCENRDDGVNACGLCKECRKVQHGNHPDLVWIEPEGASVKIEQIRELQQAFSYRTTGASVKIYIIDQADRMTAQASNSLLKFLEEPVSAVMAILITENGQALLPTIRSRAQTLMFHPMPPERLRETLLAEGLPDELVRAAVQVTAGEDAARKMIQANWFAETRNVVIQLMKGSPSSVNGLWTSVQSKLGKSEASEHMDICLDLLLLWFKDLIHVRNFRKENVVFIDQLDELERQAWLRDTSEWLRSMDYTVEAQKRIRQHANPQLVIEQLLIRSQGG